jgi:hypothetical protein
MQFPLDQGGKLVEIVFVSGSPGLQHLGDFMGSRAEPSGLRGVSTLHPGAGNIVEGTVIPRGVSIFIPTQNAHMFQVKEKIRFNAVAPGVVDTPLHKDNPKEFLKTLSPMGTISDVKDIVEAVVYLTEARQVTGEVLHVDGGAHSGKW